ncbi:MAG: hypothetical protein KKI08_05440, partial [Armatimonadetes bacterium]|nr:hypothetical protein [Armatimonadota bacterium]
IEALRKPLLAGPMRMVSSTPVTVKRTVEYDGFAKLDCTVKPGAKTLDQLVIEIPLRPEVATYLYSWPKITSRAIKADVALPFQPIVWIGDDEKGLSWMCESDQNWSLADPSRALQVVRGDTETVLRVTLVDKPVAVPKGGFTYAFALQATPLRPPGPDVWSMRYICDTWYAEDLDLPNKVVEGKPALQHYADQGVKTLVISRWWDAFAYTSPLGHEEEFRALVQACHEVGIKLIPYIGGFLLSERAPETLYFKQEMTKWPITDYPLRQPGLPPQTGFITCQNSVWQDFLVDGIARLIDEYDVDGVYLDSTTIPWLCRNELHGCGYVKPDGTRGGTYPVFAIRRHLRRIYNVVKQRKPDGLVDMHVYDCMNPAALSYCTSYWNGEQFGRVEIKTAALPLDRFRTEFMGVNWGVPADLLYYKLGNYRACTGLALLHDVPVRVQSMRDLGLLSSLWTLHDRYPYRQAQWWPYWKNGAVVQVGPEGCHASLYAHPQQGVLAYVVNLTKDEAEAKVAFDFGKLGLAGQIKAEDALSGAALALQGSVLTLPLKSQDWVAVWLRAAP